MIERHPNFERLEPTYLFQKIHEKAQTAKKELLDLSIGDISLPLDPSIAEVLAEEALRLSKEIVGYGPSRGYAKLREAVQSHYYPMLSPDEIYISDGAKCDVGRLQLLFGTGRKIGVQDPTYPVYSDTALLLGAQEVIYLPCNRKSEYFVDIKNLPDLDILFLCSPNNPTGAAATREQLTELVKAAYEKEFLIIYDAAYADFIQNPELPKSIYEIEGAQNIAIEISSFSKSFGFTGLRLGWSVVPKALKYKNNAPLYKDWERIIQTFFNGPSCLAQKGGIVALSEVGLKAKKTAIETYLSNAKRLKESFRGFEVSGGDNSPYLWIYFPQMNSWEAFEFLLAEYGILSIPGSGFGKEGEGFIRLSGFSKWCTSCAFILEKKEIQECLLL